MGIPKVFVSATSKDLCSYRKATSDTLIKKQALPVSQDYAQPDYRSVEAILRDRIAECDCCDLPNRPDIRAGAEKTSPKASLDARILSLSISWLSKRESRYLYSLLRTNAR